MKEDEVQEALSPEESQVLDIHRRQDRFIVPRVLPLRILILELRKRRSDLSEQAAEMIVHEAIAGLVAKELLTPGSLSPESVYIPVKDRPIHPELSQSASDVLRVLNLRKPPREVGLPESTIVAGLRALERRRTGRVRSHLESYAVLESGLHELLERGIIIKKSEAEVGPKGLYQYRYLSIPGHGRAVWATFGNDVDAARTTLTFSEIRSRIEKSGQFRSHGPSYVGRVTEEGIKQLVSRGVLYKHEGRRYSRFSEFSLYFGYADSSLYEMERTLRMLKESAEHWELNHPSPFLSPALNKLREKELTEDPARPKSLHELQGDRLSLLYRLEFLAHSYERLREDTLRRIFNIDHSLSSLGQVSEREWESAIANVVTLGGTVGGVLVYKERNWVRRKVRKVQDTARSLMLVASTRKRAAKTAIRTRRQLAIWGASWPSHGGLLAKHSKGPWMTLIVPKSRSARSPRSPRAGIVPKLPP